MPATQIRKMSIKAARAQKNLTQEALAQRLEVGKKTYISWENGKIDLKAYHMYAISGALGMSVDELDFP